jgi:hypothetical protein
MSWVHDALRRNLALKLLSLAGAIGIWIAVGGDVSTEILVPVPVEFRNVPEGIHYEAEPSRVELRVRGPRWMVRQAAATDFSMPVDLSRVTEPGERMIELSPENATAPLSVEVVDITPPALRLLVSAAARP